VAASNKPHDEILDHYTPECPICKGVLLPEKVEELEKELEELTQQRDKIAAEVTNYCAGYRSEIEKLNGQLSAAQAAADTWRDLYQAASGHQETGLEYRNWQQ